MQTHPENKLHLFNETPESKNNGEIILLQPPLVVARDGRYVAYDNGIVCDCYSNTEWFPGPNENTSWIEADRWAGLLSICGGGWSLASIEQLQNLYCKNKKKDPLTPLLKMEATDIWSNHKRDESSAWGFNFIPGNAFWTYCTFSSRFRALATRPKPRYRSRITMTKQYNQEIKTANHSS